MGQYHKVVNLDKREFLNPHGMGTGAKSAEFAFPKGGVMGAAMIGLMVAPEHRGGGDITGEHAGRWHGDRVVVIGDYAERADLPDEFNADIIYRLCTDDGGKGALEWLEEHPEYHPGDVGLRLKAEISMKGCFTDISDVGRAIVADTYDVKWTSKDYGSFTSWNFEFGY